MNKYIEIALKEAKKSLKSGDIPVGAVIVENGKILAKAHNEREKKHMITKHAELIALEKAGKKKKTWHLNDCELYVTLEPCSMCNEAIKQSKIKTVYYAASKNKNTVENPVHQIKIEDDKKSETIIKTFFKNLRK